MIHTLLCSTLLAGAPHFEEGFRSLAADASRNIRIGIQAELEHRGAAYFERHVLDGLLEGTAPLATLAAADE